ncbi:MAG TPA: spore coat protein U domain-containing protein [Arsenophonus sp.]
MISGCCHHCQWLCDIRRDTIWHNTNISANLTPNTSLTLACTHGTVLSMSINGGNNYTTSRNVKQSTITLLPYQLYSDNAHTSPIPVNQNIPVNYTNSNNIILPIYGVLQRNTI